MGNCVLKGSFRGEIQEMVKVVTCNGGIMELYAPITAECITNEFPGHAIYRTRDLFSDQPLLHNEELRPGHLYYLMPLDADENVNSTADPYRMSLDNHRVLKRMEPEVLPRYNGSGVWKVKLVISPEQLAEILAQESQTEALIESVRTVAKCGNGVCSIANSDQCSVSSSWKG